MPGGTASGPAFYFHSPSRERRRESLISVAVAHSCAHTAAGARSYDGRAGRDRPRPQEQMHPGGIHRRRQGSRVRHRGIRAAGLPRAPDVSEVRELHDEHQDWAHRHALLRVLLPEQRAGDELVRAETRGVRAGGAQVGSRAAVEGPRRGERRSKRAPLKSRRDRE